MIISDVSGNFLSIAEAYVHSSENFLSSAVRLANDVERFGMMVMTTTRGGVGDPGIVALSVSIKINTFITIGEGTIMNTNVILRVLKYNL